MTPADALIGSDGARSEHGDALADLAGAFLGYFLEIDGYRNVCLRCEETATVREHPSGVEVLRFYTRRDESISHLLSAAGRLTHVPSRNRRQTGDGSGELSRSGVQNPSPSLLRRDIVWENRPARVDVTAGLDSTRLRVSLLFPRLEGDLPELPLRTLAHALLCHEFLMPAAVMPPLPVEAGDGCLTVLGYLKRTMPRNLSASQWIFHPGAG